MSESPVRIRPARVEDADAAVPLIYSSGPQGFDWTFGRGPGDALAYLQAVFPSGKGFFGWQNHFVAELEDRVVGTIALYSAAEYNRMSNETLRQVLRHFRFWHWPRVLLRCLSAKKWMPPPRRHTDYVANLGVAEDCRGHGIGRQLLQFGLERARGRGKAIYALDVAETNPRAEALYERFGFRLTGMQGSPSPGVVPDAHRMEMSAGET